MIINAESMIVGRELWVIWWCDRSNTVINKVLAAFIAKNAGGTLPTPS
jgi:hypothetical protein